MRPMLVPLTLAALLAAGCAASWEPAPRTPQARANSCGAGSPPRTPGATTSFQGISVFCFESP